MEWNLKIKIMKMILSLKSLLSLYQQPYQEDDEIDPIKLQFTLINWKKTFFEQTRKTLILYLIRIHKIMFWKRWPRPYPFYNTCCYFKEDLICFGNVFRYPINIYASAWYFLHNSEVVVLKRLYSNVVFCRRRW